MKHVYYIILILSLIQLITACTIQCTQFIHTNGDYHARCSFTTAINETKCELTELDDLLTDANITPVIKVVTLQLNFKKNITRVDLRFDAVPTQKILVEVEKKNFDITTLYLLGKFEIPERNWFKNFPNVKLLVIQSVFFPTGIPIFTDLTTVTRIYSGLTEIGGNNLVIGDDFVSGLPSLDYLYFRTERTGILSIGSKDVFSQLTALSYMNLYRISFSGVSRDLMRDLVNLKGFISVTSDITDSIFLQHPNVKKIEDLNLAVNNVYEIHPFGRFRKLTKLSLYSNDVTTLVRSDFLGMKGLKELDLQSNGLKDMLDDVFYELRDVEKMNLISNQLTTISLRQFEHLRSLTSIRLGDNFLNCNCDLKWVFEVNARYGIEFEGECSDSEGRDIVNPRNYDMCDDSSPPLECFNRSHSCRPNSRCVSYGDTYVCVCIEGYRDINNSCVDINECTEGNSSCAHNCTNLPGTYECCAPGFEQDHRGICVDRDECWDGTNNCDQKCTNTYGSFICWCSPGYQLLSDDMTCTDIDECSLSLHECSDMCVNQIGSYTCTCPSGYILDTDGKTCYIGNCTIQDLECSFCRESDGTFLCVCPPGYMRVVKDGVESCEDIIECQIPDICNQGCINTVGSYECVCDPDNKYIAEDNTCVRIDPCSEGTHNCSSLQLCVNLEESFDCVCRHEHIIEGTDQCGVLPSYSVYSMIGVLALVVVVVLVCSLACCVVLLVRKRRANAIDKINKAIYNEVNLQKTARHNQAYDPINNLQNFEIGGQLAEESIPPSVYGYEKMRGNPIYESVKTVYDLEKVDSVDSGSHLINPQ